MAIANSKSALETNAVITCVWQSRVLTFFPKFLKKACSVSMSLYKEHHHLRLEFFISMKFESDLFERKIFGKFSKIPFDQYLGM